MSQRVLITAGGSGVGHAMAEAFATQGAKVWVTDIDEERIANLPEGWNGSIADASSEKAMKALQGQFRLAPASERKALATQVREMVSKSFDTIQRARSDQLDDLEKLLTQARTRLKQRVTDRNRIIERKVAEILSDAKAKAGKRSRGSRGSDAGRGDDGFGADGGDSSDAGGLGAGSRKGGGASGLGGGGSIRRRSTIR